MHLTNSFKIHKPFWLQLTIFLVAANGLFVLATTLLDQLAVHGGSRIADITIDVPLLFGISLLYLSVLLKRRKRNAWGVSILLYTFLLGFNCMQLLERNQLLQVPLWGLPTVRTLLVPLLVLLLLARYRREFTVLSDVQTFRTALLIAGLVLFATLAYGTAGFMLMDEHDFHKEISAGEAMHRTIDQFDLTTNQSLVPHTKRAHLFVDSLSFVSGGAVVYIVISFFQPLRARFGDQAVNRRRLHELLQAYPHQSEDFFKLYPHDKQYFFANKPVSALAYHVQGGVALCLGDPSGQRSHFRTTLREFEQLCYGNDWSPAFIHTDDSNRALYESRGFTLQKIGQEAIVDIAHFQQRVAPGKYFRQIKSRFDRQKFSIEMLSPPHSPAVLARLRLISNEWLARPGRVERRFVMGYYDEPYLQRCRLLVARDDAGTIQAFLNQVPADFDTAEATYDLLRHSDASPGNMNDYLLLAFIDRLIVQGYKRLNLGLAPLAGAAADDTENQTLLDAFLRFAAANGDRFYSFSGLYRFKDKYEPAWSDRYVVYKGGVRGFSRTMNALLRTMRVRGSKATD